MFQAYTKFLKNIFGFIVDGVIALVTEMKEITVDNLEYVREKLQSIGDDPTELIKYAGLATPIKNFIKKRAPFLYPSWMFWDNVDKFFNSGVLNDNDKKKLIDKLSDDKNKNDAGKKVMDIISRIDTDKKMAYILNATKVLLTNDSLIAIPLNMKIKNFLRQMIVTFNVNLALANSRNCYNLPLYFRICRTILNTLEEDLEFLSHNIEKNSVKYSIEVNGLMIAGLIYSKGLIEDGSPTYAFNEFAKIVYEYALKGNGEKKIEEFNINNPPQTRFLTENDIPTEEDIQKILDGITPSTKNPKNV